MSLALRRAVARIVSGCMILALPGCTSTRSVPVGTILTEEEPAMSAPPGLSIAGYVTSDNVRHSMDGTVTLEGDDFVFHPAANAPAEADSVSTKGPVAPFRVPRTEVIAFSTFQSSYTLLIVGACIAAAVGLVAWGASMSD
jgi:hypothetical protein